MPDLSFRSSLKNIEVEEPVDLLLHRPLGYVIARICYPTPITPDQLTIVSMLVGIVSGALLWLSIARADDSLLPYAAALFVLSAIIDCSDGQLARMRQSSSTFGRMLDGAVDAVVQISVVPAAIAHLFMRRGGISNGTAWAWAFAGVLAVLTGLRHTTLYDHYKNLWSRNATSKHSDCDDMDDFERSLAEAKAKGPLSAMDLFRFTLYRTHLTLVAATIRWVDPYVPARFKDMPAYSEQRAERYASMNRSLMRAWSFFGVGTHIFTMALSIAFNKLEAYIVLRLVGFNLAFAVLVPLQRSASRAFFSNKDSSDE
ncbi:MAG: CDP-alcohol phosphatidyltransferase family protein [Polyangiales bacterium]